MPLPLIHLDELESDVCSQQEQNTGMPSYWKPPDLKRDQCPHEFHHKRAVPGEVRIIGGYDLCVEGGNLRDDIRNRPRITFPHDVHRAVLQVDRHFDIS